MKHIPVLLIAAFSASAALAGTDAGVRQIQADTTSSRSAGIRFIKTEASPDVTSILEKDHPKEPSQPRLGSEHGCEAGTAAGRA